MEGEGISEAGPCEACCEGETPPFWDEMKGLEDRGHPKAAPREKVGMAAGGRGVLWMTMPPHPPYSPCPQSPC